MEWQAQEGTGTQSSYLLDATLLANHKLSLNCSSLTTRKLSSSMILTILSAPAML